MKNETDKDVMVQAGILLQQLLVFINKDGSVREGKDMCFQREYIEQLSKELMNRGVKEK